jgi:hypothetical protein
MLWQYSYNILWGFGTGLFLYFFGLGIRAAFSTISSSNETIDISREDDF